MNNEAIAENRGHEMLITIGIIVVLAMFSYSIGYDEGKDRAERDNAVSAGGI